jgi:1-acyl-sn-glycerol-3-phosphate acyltransferase
MTWRQRLRVALRLTVLVTATGLSGLVLLLALPLKWLAPTARARFISFVFRAWSKLFLGLLRVRVSQRGAAPTAPFFLVANHLSYMDIPLLASRADTVFIAKVEIGGWPIFGPISALANTVFVDRTLKRDIPRVLAEVDERLAHGQGVVLFPEGTSSAGADVMPFRPSLLATAAAARHPVSWASLAYRTPPGENPAHLAVCWWGGMTFGRHFLELLAMPRFEASSCSSRVWTCCSGWTTRCTAPPNSRTRRATVWGPICVTASTPIAVCSTD